jgi:hypothetical protein
MGIIELTKYQYETLNIAANGPTRVFAVLFDSAKDSEEKAKRLRQDMREAGELIGLGLAEDVSEHFKESIASMQINDDRGLAVYAITDLGVKMFENLDKRTVN